MAAQKILFPTDFSHASDACLPLVTSLARDRNAEVLILHVQEPPISYGGSELYYGPQNPDLDTLKNLLSEVRLTDAKVPCRHEMVVGDPATEIVRMAEDAKDISLIVIGTHGRKGLSRVLMGSVAENVVRRAPCPVLTLKEPRLTK